MIFNDPLFDGMNVIEFNKAKTGTSPHQEFYIIYFIIVFGNKYSSFMSLICVVLD